MRKRSKWELARLTPPNWQTLYERGLLDQRHLDLIEYFETELKEKEWTQVDVRELVLAIADRVWLQEGYEVNPTYLDFLEKSVKVSTRAVDFQSDLSAVCEQINQWAAQKTSGQINLGFSPEILTPLTRVLPVHTIYFKGKWVHSFSSPEKGGFTLLSGDNIKTNMMSTVLGSHFYLETDTYQLVRLPYKHRSLFMSIILPRDPGKTAFQKTTAHIQRDWHHLLTGRAGGFHVRLTMPEFKIKKQYNILYHVLKTQTGIPPKFQTDFSEISEEPGFSLDETVHIVDIDVNQFGTVAAAVSYTRYGTGGPPSRIIPMVVDRPFLFAIIDDLSNTLLFLGKVMNPNL